MATETWALQFGCVAVVESEETDREVYKPPPIASNDHHEQCQCGRCFKTRALPQHPGRAVR